MQSKFPENIGHFGSFERTSDGNVTVDVQVIDVAEAITGFHKEFGVTAKQADGFHSDVTVIGTPNAIAELLSVHYADDFNHENIAEPRSFLLMLFASAA